MASNAMIGFLFSAGFAAWIYAKTMRSTGQNTTTAVIVAGCAGLVAFLLVTTLLGIFFNET